MTTTISAPHPLLRSSRGRVLWSEQQQPAETTTTTRGRTRKLSTTNHDDARSVRQRTSSITSIETIRPSAGTSGKRPRKSLPESFTQPDPAPPTNATSSTTTKAKSTRKRVHSIDDEESESIIPRIRQRLMSSAKADLATPPTTGAGPDSQATVKRRITPATSVALNRLREKLVHATAESTSRASARPLPTPPVAVPAKALASKPVENPRPIAKLPQPKTAAATCIDLDTTTQPNAPLRSLSTNTTSRRALPLRVPMPGARINQFGNYELNASEFELVVAFPAPAPPGGNFEVWDEKNDLFTIGPLSLHLVFKDPAKWENLPVAHPDITILDITCASTPVVDAPDYPYQAERERDKYEVRWQGATLWTPGGIRLLRGRSGEGNGKETAREGELDIDWEKEDDVKMDPRAGITLDTVWMRTYASDCRPSPSSSSITPSPSQNTGTAKRGWELNLLIPIATALFERRETRAFRVRAEIALRGEIIRTRDDVAGATISVSHLRREREMV
ncbi:hypothetical protein FB45DRAFT_1004454 [Roridomyces roridus]|uniref:Uncharacterized protein n=1 Tax=Roridomyces roridus TaxID=1738132 RepID=A0AAD7BS76_9AGAR|nr:hypothetical protein FB45DRAFT_1004454 [Roridomyces roridus]